MAAFRRAVRQRLLAIHSMRAEPPVMLSFGSVVWLEEGTVVVRLATLTGSSGISLAGCSGAASTGCPGVARAGSSGVLVERVTLRSACWTTLLGRRRGRGLARAGERVVRRGRVRVVDVRLATLRGVRDVDDAEVRDLVVLDGEFPDVVAEDMFLGASLRR